VFPVRCGCGAAVVNTEEFELALAQLGAAWIGWTTEALRVPVDVDAYLQLQADVSRLRIKILDAYNQLLRLKDPM
jgi:hypothetical protein